MIKKIANAIKYRAFRRSMQTQNVEFPMHSFIDRDSSFEGFNSIGSGSIIRNSKIGVGTYFGTDCRFFNAKVGKYCSIGNDVEIVVGDHPKTMVSTNPVFYSRKKISGLNYGNDFNFPEYSYVKDSKDYYVEIGSDVWIGQGAKIMGGCQIGDGSIIGSYALVTKDVSPYSIVCGIPAKQTSTRFDSDVMEFLLRIRWWEKSQEWLGGHAQYFNDVEGFIEAINNERI